MPTAPDALFKSLSDPTRRALLERLLAGPTAVNELARDFPVSRPAISQHLRVLKNAELVLDQRVGTRRFYQINPLGIDALRWYFDRFDVAASPQAHLNRSPGVQESA